MPRTDTHLEGMLRHLGAAYYDSLHGRAGQAGVTRAPGTAAERLNEQSPPAAGGTAGATGQVVHASRAGRGAGIRGRSRRVGDVTATSVVTVDRAAPYKEIARLPAGRRISGMPVLKTGREAAGVVTGAGLPAAEDKTARRLRSARRPRPWSRARPHPALTAGELMTAPAATSGCCRSSMSTAS